MTFELRLINYELRPRNKEQLLQAFRLLQHSTFPLPLFSVYELDIKKYERYNRSLVVYRRFWFWER